MAKLQTPRVKNWTGTLKKIWQYLSRQKRLLIVIFLMVLLSSATGLLGPYLLGFTIDRLDSDASTLTLLLVLLAGTYVIHSVAMWLHNYWMIGVAQRTVYQMRTDLFRHLHMLPISYFTKRQHGELMSRLSNDMENVSQTLNSSFIQVFSSILTFIGMLGLMLWISPLLTAITLTIIPLLYFGMKWITARTGRYFKQQQRHLGELNGYVEETLSGQRIVKTFSQEPKVQLAFKERNEQLKHAAYWAQVYSGFIPKLMNVLNNMSFAVIATAGGLMALKGGITIGVIITFAEYARQFTRPLNDLANQFNTFLSAIAGAERVFEVLEEDEEAKDEQDATQIVSIHGELRFEHVSFGYGEDEHTLRDVSFHARPGQTIALVGPTGAGKTTVTQLLARFYDPDEGSIVIDGRDSRSIQRTSLRQHIGYVLQDTFLFEGSIRDNIRYGKLDATDEQVERAAQEANAHGFIQKLPQGYDTLLTQDGSGISQGQKQLLSIARALLADPSILILDEATSSIDTITEIKIQEALIRLMKGRTSIVIAHRLNTIRRADQIVVLQDGAIVEQGSHQELLAIEGAYADMVASQFTEKPQHA